MNKVYQRLYEDYIMSSRMDEYENIIKTAVEYNYIHLTIYEFYNLVKNNELDKNKKYFIHRHDIDTKDLRVVKEMFEIEKKYKVKSTYYFRLNTYDIKLMEEIHKYGSEVSYHYEEISQYCKDKRIFNKDLIFKNFQEIEEQFVKNFLHLQEQLSFNFNTVSSHGDHINRKLNIRNVELLKNNLQLREKLNIKCEAYDNIILNNIESYLSDTSFRYFEKKINPIQNIINGDNVILFLTHPRQWKSNIFINFKEDVNRLYEEIIYRIYK